MLMPKSIWRKKTTIFVSLNEKRFFGDGWGVFVHNLGAEVGPSLSPSRIGRVGTSRKKVRSDEGAPGTERGGKRKTPVPYGRGEGFLLGQAQEQRDSKNILILRRD